MIGNAWEASLRTEIERNLTQKTLLFAHRVETDRAHTLADIAAQEGLAAGARATIIDASGRSSSPTPNPILPPWRTTPPARNSPPPSPAKLGENERRSATLGIRLLYVAAQYLGVQCASPILSPMSKRFRRRFTAA